MKNNVSFIHIPKNAGTSIRDMINSGKLPAIGYCGHHVDPSQIEGDHILILRDPIERFTSAVRYAIQNYSKEPQIRQIIDSGYTDPNVWAEALADPHHPARELILNEVVNITHKIGNTKTEWKWTYTPQAEWFDRANPTYVLMIDSIDDDFNQLMDTLEYPSNRIPKKNTTPKTGGSPNFSEKALLFLRKTYKRDFEIFEEYRQKRLL